VIEPALVRLPLLGCRALEVDRARRPGGAVAKDGHVKVADLECVCHLVSLSLPSAWVLAGLHARRAQCAQLSGEESFVDSTAADRQYDRAPGADLTAGAISEPEVARPQADQ
jgi:hypothetical protein